MTYVPWMAITSIFFVWMKLRGHTGRSATDSWNHRFFDGNARIPAFGMGSGLGMSMVFGFAKQCGGAIRIRSRQAVGTTVALLLPVADRVRATTSTSDANARDTLDLKDKLVLLVDDDAEVRKVVRTQLAALGCSVLEA